MKKIFITFLIILVFAVSVYTVIKYNKDTENLKQNDSGSALQISDELKLTTVEKAKDFKLKDLNGQEVSLSDLKGKKIFLNFWATSCPPCRAEMPEMEKLYQETKNSDLVILAVNIGENKQKVQSFIEKNKYNFPILLDSEQEATFEYLISAIPTSFFIDKEGNIISKKIGPMNMEEMKLYLKTLE